MTTEIVKQKPRIAVSTVWENTKCAHTALPTYMCMDTMPRVCEMRNRTQTVEAARADAEKIRLLGGAEASAIEAVGKAEAERMRLKASAYKQYGEAAMLSLVLESLPKVGYVDMSYDVDSVLCRETLQVIHLCK